MQIFISTIDEKASVIKRKTITIEATPDETIASIMQKFLNALDKDEVTDDYRLGLKFAGKSLELDATLADYKIIQGSTLQQIFTGIRYTPPQIRAALKKQQEQSTFKTFKTCVFTSPQKMPSQNILNNLKKLGIKKIFLLFDQNNYLEAEQNTYQIIDTDPHQTLKKHYQRCAPEIEFVLLDTGSAIQEEDKMNFYLENNHPNSSPTLLIGKTNFLLKEDNQPIPSNAKSKEDHLIKAIEKMEEKITPETPHNEKLAIGFCKLLSMGLQSPQESGQSTALDLNNYLEGLINVSESVHKKLLDLTKTYLNKKSLDTDKKGIFLDLQDALVKPKNSSKIEQLLNFFDKIEAIEKSSNTVLKHHRTLPSWRRYLYNVVSIATVIPAIIRAGISYKKYSTTKFWQPESQRAFEAIKKEIPKTKPKG